MVIACVDLMGEPWFTGCCESCHEDWGMGYGDQFEPYKHQGIRYSTCCKVRRGVEENVKESDVFNHAELSRVIEKMQAYDDAPVKPWVLEIMGKVFVADTKEECLRQVFIHFAPDSAWVKTDNR